MNISNGWDEGQQWKYRAIEKCERANILTAVMENPKMQYLYLG